MCSFLMVVLTLLLQPGSANVNIYYELCAPPFVGQILEYHDQEILGDAVVILAIRALHIVSSIGFHIFSCASF